MRTQTTFVLLVNVLAASVAFYLLTPLFFSPLAFSNGPSGSLIHALLLAVATLIGILSQHVYVALNTPDSQHSVWAVLRTAVSSRSLWISLIVSPLVLLTVFKAAADLPDGLVAYLFAYQNGFFFKSILAAHQA
jgi:hypothetical protein